MYGKRKTRPNIFILMTAVALFVLLMVQTTSVFAECEVAKLLASDGVTDDVFGNSVAISGDTAIIGAAGDDANGSAYIFRFDNSGWTEEQKLTASDGDANDRFGSSIGISGDTAVIGAWCDDDNGDQSGSAYIFRFNGTSWVEEAKLLASDGDVVDYFGVSVAISGSTAVIGAHFDDDDGNMSGSAYIFRFNGTSWVEEAKLLASDGDVNDLFGIEVCISGDTVVIAAMDDDDNGSDSGSAYIFRFNGSSWVEEAKLLASDGAADDLFGRSVSMSGDTALIGAPHNDPCGSNSGSAYIFRFNGSSWVEEQKLTASDDGFGISVGIWGDTAVIGAWDVTDHNSGSAYIFRFNGSSWAEETKLLASDGASWDYFGTTIGISGDTAVIGAWADDDNGDKSGSAYIFGLEGATWEEKLLASDGAVFDEFGLSAGISGDTAIIGAHGDDPNGNNSGSAYIFRFNGTSWSQEDKLLATDGTEGDEFGWSVGISGDTAVIGAYADDPCGSNSGSAYIFRYKDPNSGWVQEAKLTASDGSVDDYFGYSVGIWGDTAVIGAYADGAFSGSAYIFRYKDPNSGWLQEQKLTASDAAATDYFGISVGISGDTAVIGAHSDDPNGSAYIFRYKDPNSGWLQEAKLTASDGAADDHFGLSVSISGDAAVIGAYSDDPNGSAYIFRYKDPNSGWLQEAKLLASDGASGDRFGYSVGISGDTAVVGASYDYDNSGSSGSAYVFHFNGSSWLQEAKLLASDGTGGDEFGRSVGISGDTAVIGAYGDDDNGNISGSAYIFGLSMNPGDLDLDNYVDFEDYCILAARWLETGCGPCNCDRAECTGDDSVTWDDLKTITDNWLASVDRLSGP
jgi:hypothetical protein